MAQAPQYTRATDFSNDELLNVGGRSTVRTDKLDAELDALGTTANSLVANVALNQRDDGEIRDQRVKLPSLAPDVVKLISLLGGNVRGAWVTATLYAAKDVVTQGGNTYVSAVLHTSGVFATDFAAVKWVLVQLGAATAASGVPFSPTATLAATNVQAAIDEADTENRSISAAYDAALRADLSSVALASKNAGQIGFSYVLNYLAGTLGWALKENGVSAGWYNVAADGVTDDSAKLVLANAAAIATGKPLLLKGVMHIASPTTITAPIVDTMTQLFSITSQITIDNGQPVRAEWFGSATGFADLAVNALPSTGGTVLFSLNRTAKAFNHAYNGAFLSKSNVRLQGLKMPRMTTDARALTDGTILRGTLLAFADNFEMRDIGVDCGKTVVDALYASADTDALIITFNSDAAKAANTLHRGLRLHNVIGLGPKPDSVSHAIIMGEGYDDVVCTGEVAGAMATHALVIKGSNVKADLLCGYLSSRDGLILKTDVATTAVARDVHVKSVFLRAQGPVGVTPYVAAVPQYGLLFEASSGDIDKVRIDAANIVGYPTGVGTVFGSTYSIRSISIGTLEVDLFGVAGTTYALDLSTAANQNIRRWRIDTLEARNCTAAVHLAMSMPAAFNNHLSIGALYASSCTYGVDIGSQSYADIGILATDTCSNAMLRFTGTPSLAIGARYRDASTPADYSATGGGLVPAFSNSWTDVAGFALELTGYRKNLRGKAKPGTTNVMMTLPQWAWPAVQKDFMLQGYNGATVVSVPVTVSTAGVITVNLVAGGFANVSTWLSLDGASWD